MTTSICKNLESFAKTFLNMIPDVTFPPIRYTSKKDTEGHSRYKKLNNCVCLLAMLITLEKCQNSNTIKFFMITSTKHSRKHQIIEDFNKSRSFKVLPTTLIGRLNGVQKIYSLHQKSLNLEFSYVRISRHSDQRKLRILRSGFYDTKKLETGLPRNPSCHLMNPGTAEKELTKQQHIKLHFNQLLLIDISNKITD